MTNLAPTSLVIHKMSDGGYTVGEEIRGDRFYSGPLFACSEIGEALAFIKKTLNPPTVTVSKVDADMANVIKVATDAALRVASRAPLSVR